MTRALAVLLACLGAASAAAAERVVSGRVFVDEDGDGRATIGEPGVAGAFISDQHATVATADDGRYRIAARGDVLFVRTPPGLAPAERFWQPVPETGDADFAVVRRDEPGEFTFVHASDTHVSDESVARIRLLRALVERRRPAFVIVTGDLVKDALRVGEEEARRYYDLYAAEIAAFPVPVWSAPGNHENFGVERHLSGVSRDHPLFGKGMYRHYLGPNYYSFDWGGVHFIALDSVDIQGSWYHGRVDAAQLAWLEGNLATVPDGRPVVTFCHIPLLTTATVLWGYREADVMPGTVMEVDGTPRFRHVVMNLDEVLARLARHDLSLALGGHVHYDEQIHMVQAGRATRFHQAAAVLGPVSPGRPGAEGLPMQSGVRLYRVRDGVVDDGEFLPLDEPEENQ